MTTAIPKASWPSGYRREWLRPDVIAGVTTAAVVIPKAMAYASIAGLPVNMGLYVALVPMLVYALLGTSRPLSVSSTSTIAILTAGQLAAAVPNGSPMELATAAAALALLTGAVLLLAGFLRLGFLANFISDPVLTGFKAGLGAVIVASQLPALLGLPIDHSGFFQDIWDLLQHLAEIDTQTLILAVCMFVLIFGLERFVPRAPAPLMAIVLGIASSGLLGLSQSGVAVVGRIPAGLPLPDFPDMSLIGSLWPGALGIALMSFIESIAAGHAFTRAHDSLPVPNRELVALGAANIAGGCFQAFPAGGGTSQTAVNSGAGARTQAAALVTVLLVATTLLVLAPVFSLLPQAVLAAIVVTTSLSLLGTKDFRAISRVRLTELLWALAASAGVIILGTLEGILVAVAISVMTLFYEANHPPLYALGRKPGTGVFRPLTGEHPGDEVIPGLLIVRTEGRMTFASAPRVRERLWKLIDEVRPQVLLLECSAIPDFEYTALRALMGLEEKLGERGIALWLATLNPEALRVVRRSPLGEILGPDRMFHNLREAVDAYENRSSTGTPAPHVRTETRA